MGKGLDEFKKGIEELEKEYTRDEIKAALKALIARHEKAVAK